MSTVRKKRCRGFDVPPENVSEVEAHRIRFEAELEKYHAKQGPNSQIFTKEKLDTIITTLQNYEQMTWPVIYVIVCSVEGLHSLIVKLHLLQEKKSSGGYRWNRRYYVDELPGGDKILLKTENYNNPTLKMAQAAQKGEIFNILRDVHLSTGHGKELVIFKNVSKSYFNISRIVCGIFCDECATCALTRNNVKKCKAGHRPILTSGFGSRGQVDLVDLQSSEYEGMKWLLSYVDHGTKYAATCALPNKQVKLACTALIRMHLQLYPISL